MHVGVDSHAAVIVPVAGTGVTANVVASVFHATFTDPVAWLIAVGTAWQSPQAIDAERRRVPVRCVWCAPTFGFVGSVVPDVAVGGAAFVPLPWQLLHCAVFCRVPFTCSVVADVPVPLKMIPPDVFTTVLWHGLQAVVAADFDTVVWTASPGAAPWQLPHVALTAVFQLQTVMAPFCWAVSDAPWQ